MPPNVFTRRFRFIKLDSRNPFTLASFAVLKLLLRLAFFAVVVVHTPSRRTLLPMRIPAPKRASQIVPPCVTGMRQKKDPAIPAARQPRTHLRPRSPN